MCSLLSQSRFASSNQRTSNNNNYQHHTFNVAVSKSSIIHDQESVPYTGLIFFALVVVSVLYPAKVWSFILSVKSGQLFQQSKSSSSSRSSSNKNNNHEDDDYIPKELKQKKTKTK
ncbi:hypothetical protein SAMD00019534_094620 [Acytostelium subglobosum LB1]|uniref:hypothetical protein n=1 Tax=Acytostelium subglobosum LB1 TaxID=1410327 RepID=UPI000644BBC0|nr:hypothetical protein SAMD00019534_094620 [Acytostelium subglobosum LB1]GAM26287.1 hypothetical protein SAMD00019534_094620 [Acytostelium subglobosum LB1]|eukprot:XP_012750841.1 hypothetical protein SAMD00019534_094620 [Acytostelium subglobosum LB1]